MEYKTLLFEKKNNLGIIRMNNPDKLNALILQNIQEVSVLLDELEKDSEIRVVIITGQGKAFIAGADISYMRNLSAQEAVIYSGNTIAIYEKMHKSPKVFIAAVNGYALGGGCEFAMACDIRVASGRAKFGLPEVSLGILPGGGGTQRLPHLVGIAKAKELILTGKTINAEEALKIGLINQIVPEDELLDNVLDLADQVLKNAPLAVAYAKECLNASQMGSLMDGIEFEKNMFGLCFATKDQKEGMQAFMEKTTPEYEGR